MAKAAKKRVDTIREELSDLIDGLDARAHDPRYATPEPEDAVGPEPEPERTPDAEARPVETPSAIELE